MARVTPRTMASKGPVRENILLNIDSNQTNGLEQVLSYNRHIARPHFWKLAYLLHKLNELEQSVFMVLVPADIKIVLNGFQAHCWAVLAEGRATPIIIQLCILMADYIYSTTQKTIDVVSDELLSPDPTDSAAGAAPQPGLVQPGSVSK